MSALVETLRRWRHTAIPLPLKYGRRFRQVFALLQKHQDASRDELEDYQWRQIKTLLAYAWEHVPFYQERFKSIGLHPADVRSRDDFRKIPYLTREDVATHQEELKSDEFDKLNPVSTVTSGTSRDHLKVYRSADAEIWRKAMMWRHFFNIGYRFREPRVQFMGRLRFLTDHDEMPIDYNENLLMIEQDSIRFDHSPVIYRRLKEFAPKLIYCQPANLGTLALFFQEHKFSPFHVPIVYTTGEIIYPQYRRALESFFDCTIVDYYGNRENTVAAVQLSDGRKYIESEYCYLEFVDEEGRAVIDKQADIVATSLVNYAFPLIRYHTDDVGICYGYPRDAVCNYPVMEIIGGRGKDLILTRRGLMFPQVDPEQGVEKFQRVRVEQLSLEHLHITFVPTTDFREPDDREFLRREYQDYFGDEFRVTIEMVEDIPFTESGKNKLYVSQLAMDYLRDKQSQ